jgi:hypothetical protein
VQVDLPAAMARTMDIVRKVDSMSACAKVATKDLLRSCSSLEASFSSDGTKLKTGIDVLLDDSMGTYSARLAVCELIQASASVPKGCESFVPRKSSMNANEYQAKYDDNTQADTKTCINALYNVNQAWTSFCHSKQDALLMCRAARSDLDKEESLHVADILAQTAQDASSTLHDAVKQANNLKAGFHELVPMVSQLHKALADEHEHGLGRVKQLWSEFQEVLKGDAAEMSSELKDLLLGVEAATEVVDDLESKMKTATDSSLAMSSAVTSASRDVEEYVEEYVRVAAQTVSAVTRNLTSMNDFVRTLVESHVEAQFIAGQINGQLVSINSTMGSLSTILDPEWSNIKTYLTDAALYTIYIGAGTFIGYGTWERFLGYSKTASILSALGTSMSELLLSSA